MNDHLDDRCTCPYETAALVAAALNPERHTCPDHPDGPRAPRDRDTTPAAFALNDSGAIATALGATAENTVTSFD